MNWSRLESTILDPRTMRATFFYAAAAAVIVWTLKTGIGPYTAGAFTALFAWAGWDVKQSGGES